MLATGTIVDGRVETPRFMHTAVHLDGSKERGSTDHGLCRGRFYAELRCTAKTQRAERVVNTACHGTDCRRPLRARSPASTSSFSRMQFVNLRWQMEPACSHPTSADLGLIKHRWSRKLGFPALRRRRSLAQGIQSQARSSYRSPLYQTLATKKMTCITCSAAVRALTSPAESTRMGQTNYAGVGAAGAVWQLSTQCNRPILPGQLGSALFHGAVDVLESSNSMVWLLL